MRVLRCTRSSRPLPFLVGLIAVAALLGLPVQAEAADPRLESAQQRSQAVQQRLNEVLANLDRVQAETARIEDRVAELRQQALDHQRRSVSANRLLVERIRSVYKRGETPAVLAFLTADKADDATERARVLTMLAQRDRLDSEIAVAARIRATAVADQVETAVAELDAKQAELDAARRDVQAALAEARAQEVAVEQTIAREVAARERAARERAARQREAAAAAPVSSDTSTGGGDSGATGGSGSSGGGGGGGAPVSGGIACPVGTPRSYSDTWGAPRSGGRSHQGTDILAPRGTPSYAYEAGSILRMNNSSLGGISLYLRGNSGNVYYYTHLQGYASGMSAGKSVSAGELIAYVGDTGNAAGIPHLHFEVAPGGGSAVNPYPYVKRACG
ncbi:MAG TPA: peptidoglycan DD-metalloendopeptidase family protein [Egibacteraceae bacterium]|nr:peptidoglycan DD-metalloendopeptidase family protein [Egibacteraceae bacterium]